MSSDQRRYMLMEQLKAIKKVHPCAAVALGGTSTTAVLLGTITLLLERSDGFTRGTVRWGADWARPCPDARALPPAAQHFQVLVLFLFCLAVRSWAWRKMTKQHLSVRPCRPVLLLHVTLQQGQSPGIALHRSLGESSLIMACAPNSPSTKAPLPRAPCCAPWLTAWCLVRCLVSCWCSPWPRQVPRAAGPVCSALPRGCAAGDRGRDREAAGPGEQLQRVQRHAQLPRLAHLHPLGPLQVCVRHLPRRSARTLGAPYQAAICK